MVCSTLFYVQINKTFKQISKFQIREYDCKKETETKSTERTSEWLSEGVKEVREAQETHHFPS